MKDYSSIIQPIEQQKKVPETIEISERTFGLAVKTIVGINTYPAGMEVKVAPSEKTGTFAAFQIFVDSENSKQELLNIWSAIVDRGYLKGITMSSRDGGLITISMNTAIEMIQREIYQVVEW